MLKKKKLKLLLLWALALCVFVPGTLVKAALPTVINYQGRLSDALNAPLSGQYDFRFRLYDDAAKTTLLWGPEEYLNESVSNGYFSVPLGSIESFSAAGLDFTDQYWLTIQIKENAAGVWDDETDPPVSFSSNAYALNAEKVESASGFVAVGGTIQGGAALLGAEVALSINTGAGFSGDLLTLGNNGTDYWRVDSVGDLYLTGTQRMTMTNNAVNNLIGLKIVNTNDVGNYAGSILELKGSGADYTNNVYFGKYGDGFWVPSWAGNGVLATDQDLILGSMGSSDVTNPNADPRIVFQVGGGYTTPITTAVLSSDNFNLLPYGTGAGNTSSLRFSELAANGSNYVALKAADNIAADLSWTLPSADGAAGNVLTTNGAGILSWGAVAAPSVANGIVDNAGVIELGGSLNKNTNIDFNTFDLNFTASNGYALLGDSKSEFMYGDSYFTVEDVGFELEAGDASSVTNLYMRSDSAVISNYDPGTGLPVATFNGLTYDVDYSANYVDRSLVDKAYVDSHISEVTMQGAADNSIAADGYVYYLTGAVEHEDDGGAAKIEVKTGGYEFELRSGDYGSAINLRTESAPGLDDGWMRITDNRPTTRGLEYDLDYSAGFTNRSLVDKEYVDGLLTSAENLYNTDGTLTGARTVSLQTNNLLFNSTGSTGLFTIDSTNDRIGIGTDSPDYDLDVLGDVGVDGYIYHNDDSNTYSYFTPDRWQLFVGGRSMIDAQYADNEITVNEGGTQNDFRVESGNLEHLFFVDGSEDKVGIGTASPSSIFHVNSNDVNTVAISTFQNTAGDFQLFRVDASPESAVTASIGDLAVDSTGGALYIKQTGTLTNTGWSEVISSAVTLQDATDNSVAADGYASANFGASYLEDLGATAVFGANPGGKTITFGDGDGNGLFIYSYRDAANPAQIKLVDNRGAGEAHGLEYNADYSADYTARSLVDKEYVDSLIPAGGVVTQIDLTVASSDGAFSSGGYVGYQAANDICNTEYPGSHFCRTDEVIEYIAYNSTAAFAGTAWIAEGPPGYTSNSNDCNGWTVNAATSLGAFWEFIPAGGGMGWLTNCGVAKPIACCQ